jgi:hypothetical protein
MSRRAPILTAGLLALGLGTTVASADVWDLQTNNDNSTVTVHNELVHGTEQIHDLAGFTDRDYYIVGQKPLSSYEVVVDSASGDLGLFGPTVLRVESDGTSVLQGSLSVSPGRDYARSLRWANTLETHVNNEYVLVHSQSCTSGCDSADVYHIRLYETTTSIARFNNSGTQRTVLILQNPTYYGISGVIYYWGVGGNVLGSESFEMPSNFLLVIQTNDTVPGVAGSITVAHNARYGDLKGKAVALEPSTGFSFDTPMESRPR